MCARLDELRRILGLNVSGGWRSSASAVGLSLDTKVRDAGVRIVEASIDASMIGKELEG